MNNRAREILLRWGCFSEDYVKRAELLCDVKRKNGKRRSWSLLCLLVGIVAPILGILPFMFELQGHDEDPSRHKMMVSSMWLGFSQGFNGILVMHTTNLAVAKISTGLHTIRASIAASFVLSLIHI